MGSSTGDLDIHDLKSIGKMAAYMIGSAVLTNVTQLLSHINFGENALLVMSIWGLFFKILERLLSNYAGVKEVADGIKDTLPPAIP